MIHAIDPSDAGYTQIVCIFRPVDAWIMTSTPNVFMTKDMYNFSPHDALVTCIDCMSSRIKRRSALLWEKVHAYLSLGPSTLQDLSAHVLRDPHVRTFGITPAMLRRHVSEFVASGKILLEERPATPAVRAAPVWYKLPPTGAG
jgi:hypothetical protein